MNLSVAAAGAKLLAESARIQKLTLIVFVTQNSAHHSAINFSRRKLSTLTFR
jgi:hypothetical protein